MKNDLSSLNKTVINLSGELEDYKEKMTSELTELQSSVTSALAGLQNNVTSTVISTCTDFLPLDCCQV